MLIGVLWVAQVTLFAAGWLGPWRDAPELQTNGRVARPIRMVLSASLVVVASLIWIRSTDRVAPYAQWIVLGMAASCIGDLIMAKLIPLPNRLIGGMAAFGLAHGLYINGYVHAVRASGAGMPRTALWGALAVYGLASASGWWLLVRNPQKDWVLNLGALVYGTWVSIMAAFAFTLAAALAGAWWLAALGGTIFVVSDLLIGMTDIRGVRLTHANDWIWLTYVAGQMGIIYAPWVRSLFAA